MDLAAIAANTRWFAERSAGAALMAVVKADAFGHGAAPVARAALAAGASWLGVARMREALELRSAGIVAPVLAWVLEPALVRQAIDRNVDVSASSIDDLEQIAGCRARFPAAVHLKLDTGLHRAGSPASGWLALVMRAAALEAGGRLQVRGLWSHLSHADVLAHPNNLAQRAALADGVAVARQRGLRPDVTHLANSGGVIQLGSAGCSMVRVGAGLYGIDVLDGRCGPSGLRAAMTVSARVVGVRDIDAGEGIGYGHDAVAPRPTRLALVPVGYADGLPRVAARQASMWCAGRRVPVIGRISMDLTVLDVGTLPVRVGDTVRIMGDGSDGAPTAADWARWAGTIPHEILTHIGDRITRSTVGGDL